MPIRLFRRASRAFAFSLLPFACFGASLAAGAPGDTDKAPTPQQAAFFESKIRPLLAANCYACHGPTQQSAGLRLDSRAAILKGGASGPALVPGDAAHSLICKAVSYSAKLKMPPTAKLRPEEIAALGEWVQMGAPWPEAAAGAAAAPGGITPEQRRFWSFQPVRKPALPAVKNAAWVRSPIDRFILAKLEAKGLKPAPPADRRTLIRRAYLDLVGLPPTPPEVAAFLADRSPNAFANVVDSLLASTHYGERWGRHWLDVARYSDSNGLDENTAFGNAFRYRDWVVDAMNRDEPYDQFAMEQLAGDLLAAPDDSARNRRLVATGFLCLGPKVLAEPDKPKLAMDIVDEQIEVTSKAFLGLTVACARCHNHKFDPIPTRDYYGMAGIFKSTRCMQSLDTVARVFERPLMTRELQAKIDDYNRKLKDAEASVKRIADPANAALLAELKSHAEPYFVAAWMLAHQPALKSVGDSSVGGPARQTVEAESFARGSVGRDTTGYGKGIGIILNINLPDFAEWDVNAPADGDYQLELRYASAEERPVRLLVNGAVVKAAAAGQNTGSFYPEGQRWEVEGLYRLRAGKNLLRIESDRYIPHFDKLMLVPAKAIYGDNMPRSAEAIAGNSGLHADLVAELAARLTNDKDETTARQRLNTGKDGLLKLPDHPERFYAADARSDYAKASAAEAAIRAMEPKPPVAIAVEEGTPQDVRIHIRGSTENLGDVAPRHFLTVLDGDRPLPDPKRSGRLALARWIARPENPLFSRVEVNRIWEGHFGKGIVRTPDNWGLLGDRPAQPELLDWLAATFVADGYSLKKMHRRIMLSNAYQMSSTGNPKAELLDPENRLVWHMDRQRMDAEAFRDSILAVAGNLDEAYGGSLLTTADFDYVTNDQSANQAQYSSPRRSIYLPVIRNALFDMFQAFDFGDPSMTHAQRASTTVAPQALYVMNSPFLASEAAKFARSLLSGPATTDHARIESAYERAFCRPAMAQEAARANGFLYRYEAQLERIMPDAGKRRERAWQALCQAIFASNPFIYID